MPLNQPVIVITDLDGTLLDHNTYQFDAALPALRFLKQTGIPLVLSSSKTAAEIIELRHKLHNHDPFVVENGAGIYLPSNDDYEKISFGIERKEILSVLQEIREQEAWRFVGFNDMSVADIIEHTGLNPAAAEQAKQRDFTEPLKWLDDKPKLELFRNKLASYGLTAVQGGRFISISGKVDKGRALSWLRDYYQTLLKKSPYIIALGDSENDRCMLENAELAVLVRSPAHSLPDIDVDNLRITKEYGPQGWNDSLLDVLKT